MPNYNLVVTAGYKPYTFDELAKPLMMYKQEYEKYQDAINTMQDNASIAKYYIDENLDKEMLQTHQQYMDDVRALSDELAGGAGLTAETTSRALALRRRFAKDIAPMLKAAQERDAEVKEQRQALLKNPNLIFSRDAMSTPISEYMKATRDAYTPYDLDKIYQKAAAVALGISASYSPKLSIKDAIDINGRVVPGMKEKSIITGPNVSADTVMKDIMQDEDSGAYSNYKEALKTITSSLGLDKMKDGDLKNALYNSVIAGFASGIKTNTKTDYAKVATGGGSGRSGSGTGKTSKVGERVQTDSSSLGLTDKDKKDVVKVKDKLGIKTKEKGTNPAFGVRPLSFAERQKRAKALGINTNIAGFTTPALEELWDEYEKAEKLNYDIITEDNIKGGPFSWLGRILGRISSGGIDIQRGPTGIPIITTKEGLTFRNAEEKKKAVLEGIRKEYNKELDEIFDLPKASEYFTRDNFSLEGLENYYDDMMNSQDFLRQKYTYKSSPKQVKDFYTETIANLPEDRQENHGIFDADNNKKVKKSDIMGDIVKENSVFSPTFIETLNGNIRIGFNLNGHDYYVRGSGAVDSMERQLNTTSKILKSSPATLPSKNGENGSTSIADGVPTSISTYSDDAAVSAQREISDYDSLRIEVDPDSNMYYITNNSEGVLGMYSSKEEAQQSLSYYKGLYLQDIINNYADFYPGVDGVYAFRIKGNKDTKNVVILNGQIIEIGEKEKPSINSINQEIANSFSTSLRYTAVKNADASQNIPAY